ASCLRITAHNVLLFEPTDVASGDPLVYLAERWIEAPVEPNHHSRVQRTNLEPAPIDSGYGQTDRLLPQHRLTGAYRASQQVDVRRRCRGDHHRVHHWVIDDDVNGVCRG